MSILKFNSCILEKNIYILYKVLINANKLTLVIDTSVINNVEIGLLKKHKWIVFKKKINRENNISILFDNINNILYEQKINIQMITQFIYCEGPSLSTIGINISSLALYIWSFFYKKKLSNIFFYNKFDLIKYIITQHIQTKFSYIMPSHKNKYYFYYTNSNKILLKDKTFFTKKNLNIMYISNNKSIIINYHNGKMKKYYYNLINYSDFFSKNYFHQVNKYEFYKYICLNFNKYENNSY